MPQLEGLLGEWLHGAAVGGVIAYFAVEALQIMTCMNFTKN